MSDVAQVTIAKAVAYGLNLFSPYATVFAIYGGHYFRLELNVSHMYVWYYIVQMMRSKLVTMHQLDLL